MLYYNLQENPQWKIISIKEKESNGSSDHLSFNIQRIRSAVPLTVLLYYLYLQCLLFTITMLKSITRRPTLRVVASMFQKGLTHKGSHTDTHAQAHAHAHTHTHTHAQRRTAGYYCVPFQMATNRDALPDGLSEYRLKPREEISFFREGGIKQE